MAYNVPLSSLNANDGNVTYTQNAVLRVGAGGNVTVAAGLFESGGTVGIGTSVSAGNALAVQGNIVVFGSSTSIGGNIYVGNVITSNITTLAGTSANIVIDPDGSGNLFISQATPVQIYNATASTSNVTGALTVGGGVAVGGNIYVAGNIIQTSAGSFVSYSTTAAATATGSNQATAYPISTGVTVFTSVPAGTGAVLPQATSPGNQIFIANDTSTPMLLYPPVGGTIDQGTTNQAVLVTGLGMWLGTATTRLNYTSISPDTIGVPNQITVIQGNANVSIGISNTFSTAGTMAITNTTAATSSTTGAFTVSGGIGAGNGIIISGNVGIGTSGPLAQLHIGNATATNAHVIFDAGVRLTTQRIGAMEYDGNVWYQTANLTSGRGVIPHTQQFYLTSARGAVGSATVPAAFFGPGANVGVLANSTYEFEFNLFFTKTTNGTVTFRLEEAAAPVNLNANYFVSNSVSGGATANPAQTASLFNSTAAAAALPATQTLTTGVNYFAQVKGIVDTNATSGGNIFLSYLASAGTVTPLRGSYFKITRLPAGNVGTFL